jgi:hypothetical protein
MEHDLDTMTIENVMNMTASRNTANDILKEILDTKLHKEVLKYITPFLSADISLLEDAINKSINDDSDESTESVPKKTKNSKMVPKKKVHTNDTESESSNSNSEISKETHLAFKQKNTSCFQAKKHILLSSKETHIASMQRITDKY